MRNNILMCAAMMFSMTSIFPSATTTQTQTIDYIAKIQAIGIRKFQTQEFHTLTRNPTGMQFAKGNLIYTITPAIAKSIYDLAGESSEQEYNKRLILTPDNSSQSEDRIVLQINSFGTRDADGLPKFDISDTNLYYLNQELLPSLLVIEISGTQKPLSDNTIRTESKYKSINCYDYQENRFARAWNHLRGNPQRTVGVTAKIDEVAAHDMHFLRVQGQRDEKRYYNIVGVDANNNKYTVTLRVKRENENQLLRLRIKVKNVQLDPLTP